MQDKQTARQLPASVKLFAPESMARNVLILGSSGRGKSFAIRNLNPKTTAVINTEKKILPFKNHKEFKFQFDTSKNALDIFDTLKYLATVPQIETIVIDSFSEWSEDVLKQCNKLYKNYDIYGFYAEYVANLFTTLKKLSSRANRTINVFVIAHDDVIQTKDGDIIKSAKVLGKKMTGTVEKNFTVVLYATVLRDDGDNKHVFQTQSDGVVPAKSPDGMFDSNYIDNDYKQIVEAMDAYWG